MQRYMVVFATQDFVQLSFNLLNV